MRFQFLKLKPRKDVASAEQVRALRERRGWTAEQLADEVHASPLEVSAWEAGTVAAPSKQALLIRWHTERVAWGEALRTAQERTCPWVRENAPDLYEQLFRKPAGSRYTRDEPVRAHLAGCARCNEVWKEARRIGGFPAKPDTSGSLWAQYRQWAHRLPRQAAAPTVPAARYTLIDSKRPAPRTSTRREFSDSEQDGFMRFRIPGLLSNTLSAEEVRGVREGRGWTAEELADGR